MFHTLFKVISSLMFRWIVIVESSSRLRLRYQVIGQSVIPQKSEWHSRFDEGSRITRSWVDDRADPYFYLRSWGYFLRPSDLCFPNFWTCSWNGLLGIMSPKDVGSDIISPAFITLICSIVSDRTCGLSGTLKRYCIYISVRVMQLPLLSRLMPVLLHLHFWCGAWQL